MATYTTKLLLPRPETGDYFNRQNYLLLVDAIEANAIGQVEKAAANGVATLDANIKIPLAQIPTTLTGKDADTVDGKHASDLVQYVGGAVPISVPVNLTNQLNVYSNKLRAGGTNNTSLIIGASGEKIYLRPGGDSVVTGEFILDTTGATIGGNKVWTSGNDGAGSLLDADLLDGRHASDFSLTTHNHDDTYFKKSGQVPGAVLATDLSGNVVASSVVSTTELNYLDGATSNIQTQINSKLASSSYTASDVLAKLITVDGAGSLLDADTVDGLHASAFATSGHNHDGTYVKVAGDGVTGLLSLNRAGDGVEILKLNTERSWSFFQKGTLATANLELKSSTDGKAFIVTGPAGTEAFKVNINEAGGHSAVVSGGLTVNATLAAQNVTEGGTSLGSKYAAIGRTITAGSGLSGGGDLTANRTLSVVYGGNGTATSVSRSDHNHTLDSLSNTTITANSNGEILKWDGLAWVNNTLAEAGIAPLAHVGAGGSEHAAVTTTVNGFMTFSDKVKLDGIATNANNYSHPTGDGNLHVPATSTTNNGKVLKAGATAGSLSWGNITFAELTSKPTTLSGFGITDAAPSSHVGSSGSAHALATVSVAGFMSAADKTKLDGVATGANNYSHPVGDGNLHIPATGTVNDRKFLRAGATAGSVAWEDIDFASIINKPTTLSGYGITDAASTSHPGSGGDAHALVTTTLAGFMSPEDKTKINGIAVGANNYSHPTGDGNLHVPATGTTNSGRILKAGATAGSLSWGTLAWSDIQSRPTTLSGFGITDAAPSSHVGSGGTSHAAVTTTTNGFMIASDKTKLDGIASGAEVNQNAFSNVVVGASTISADSKSDSLTLIAGNNITLTPDTANDGVTIAVTNSNAFRNVLANGVTISSDALSDTLEFVAGTGLTVTGDATNDKVTYAVSMSDTLHGNRGGGSLHSVATTSSNGFMSSTDKTKLDAMKYSASATLPATVGWYRIAQSATGIGRNYGRFEVDWTVSGQHGMVVFNATQMYGVAASTVINQVAYSNYDSTKAAGITKARIVYHTTYTGNFAYVEVYNASAVALTVNVDLLGSLGWTLTTPSTAGSIPTGYSNLECLFDDGLVTTDQLVSRVATGIAPFEVSSTTAVANLNADMVDGVHLSGLVQTSRAVNTGSGLTGGGNLTADRTISVSFGGNGTATTVSRSDHTHTLAGLTDTTITTPVSGNLLRYNGTAWVNALLSSSDIPSLDWSKITSGKPTTISGYGITDAVNTSDVVTIPTANKILKLDANSKLPANITGSADGNAATATKLQTGRSIALGGDVTGSAVFDGSANVTITATIADDSHNHIIANIDGLQTALDGKSATTHNHSLASLTDTTIGSVAADQMMYYNGTAWVNSSYPSVKAIQQSGYRTANTSATGNRFAKLASIKLTSQYTVSMVKLSLVGGEDGGTSNTGQSATVYLRVKQQGALATAPYIDLRLMENQNIDTSHFTAVTTVNSTTETIVELYVKIVDTYETYSFVPVNVTNVPTITFYDNAALLTALPAGTQTVSQWDTIDNARLPSNVALLTSNVASATKLQTARTISLGGDVTGSVSFDGTANVTITTTIADDSHNHTIANVDGLQTALDGKSATTHNHTLDGLSNTSITTNTAGEILKWNGTAWINNTLSEAGISAVGHTHAFSELTSRPTTLSGYGITDAATSSHNHTLDALSNTTITSNTAGEILKWSGTAWINNTLAEAGISAVGHTHSFSEITSKPTTLSGYGITDAVSSTGNAASASKWATARTVTLGGDLSGSVSIDGTANVTLTATVADNSHSHNNYTPFSTVSATTAATAGWYRVAQSAVNIGANSGIFKIDFSGTGVKGRALLAASCHDGAASGSGVGQLGFGSSNLTLGLTQARVVYHTTATGNYAYLEVYNPTALAITYTVDLVNGTGWSLVTPSTVGSIPTGYTSETIVLDVGLVSAEDVTATRQLVSKVASGTAPLVVSSTTAVGNLNADLLDGYHASSFLQASANAVSASKLATARTITLSGGVTGSANFDGSANITITTTHADTSTLSGAYTGLNQVVDGVTVDSNGHVTALTFSSLTSSHIPSLDWSKITTGKPTTLAGYGITNGVANGSRTTDYIWVQRNSTGSALYATNQGTGNIAQFHSGAGDGTLQTRISNIGSIVLENLNATIEMKHPTGTYGVINTLSDATREILQLRGATDLASGAGFNVYGNGDSSNSGNIIAFTNNTARLIVHKTGETELNSSLFMGGAINFHAIGATNYDQIYFSDTSNTYHFTADATTENAVGNATLRASSFSTGSAREYKKNISSYEESALEKIINTPIREYHYKWEEDVDKLHVGVIVDESPEEIISKTEDAVDSYPMAAMAWKAIQELKNENDKLKAEIEIIKAKLGL